MALGHLTGKVALITGGSKGIGKALALRLAKDGANLVINYSSDAKAADEVVNTIGRDRAIAIRADAGKLADMDRLVNETIQNFGKIDILVANAALLFHRTLEATTEQDFDSTYAVNVKGPYFLCQVSFMPFFWAGVEFRVTDIYGRNRCPICLLGHISSLYPRRCVIPQPLRRISSSIVQPKVQLSR